MQRVICVCVLHAHPTVEALKASPASMAMVVDTKHYFMCGLTPFLKLKEVLCAKGVGNISIPHYTYPAVAPIRSPTIWRDQCMLPSVHFS